jgi:hypothetical protein
MTPNHIEILLMIVFVALPAAIWAGRIAVLIKDIVVVTALWMVQMAIAAAHGRW